MCVGFQKSVAAVTCRVRFRVWIGEIQFLIQLFIAFYFVILKAQPGKNITRTNYENTRIFGGTTKSYGPSVSVRPSIECLNYVTDLQV